MKFQSVSGTAAEKFFVRGLNTTGSAVSAGHLVCWHVRTAASANGFDMEDPVTSALPAFVGVADADIAAGDPGFVQVYGYSNKTFVSASGGEVLAPGQVVGPVTGQVYANSAGTSTQIGPIVILSQRTGGNAANPTFIREL